MVIDSIQVSPFHLPFQAWPMMMAPAYGGGGSLTSQGLPGSMLSGLAGPASQMLGGYFGPPPFVGSSPLGGQPPLGGQFGPTLSSFCRPIPFPDTPMPGPWGGLPVYTGGPLALQAMGVPVQTTALIEQQALNSLLQDMTAGPIRKLHDYLDAHSQKHNQLIHCVPVVQQAARAFGAQDYTQALTQIYQAYRYIAALRASIPDLPSV